MENKEKIVLAIYEDGKHTRDNIVFYLNPKTSEKFNEVPKGYKVVYDEE